MNFLRVLALVLLTAGLSACSVLSGKSATSTSLSRPNVVLILVDDAALMDFGVYGGEAATPNIDQLAARGTMFTNFHTSPMCAPSRAMLLTGFDSHRTGVPNLPLFLPQEIQQQPGYEGVLNDEVQTIAELLKQHDYDTFITGKWNLGHTDKTLPTKRGFDRSFILDASGADNYEHRPYLPGQPKPPWFKDGKAVDLPNNFYSSRFLVDQMIEFMQERRQAAPAADNPFFSYIAFQAVHIPVQAPQEYTDKYIPIYSRGWDQIRTRRIEKAKSIGLFPDGASVGEMLPIFKGWDEQSDETQKITAKSMAVNAGMLDAMDHHIGRYVDYLKHIGEFENTVFIVTSDNGPEASDPSLLPGMSEWLRTVGYRRDYDALGDKGSFVFIGPEFATAAAGPSAFFKFYAGEGGLRVPLILSGPGIPANRKVNAFSFVTDVAPTILEFAGLPPVDSSGKSAVAVIRGESNRIYAEDEGVGMEAGGQAAYFRGNFKLVRNNPPYGDAVWRLHNIARDPGETRDLSAANPMLFAELRAGYAAYAEENGVITMPEGYELIKQILLNNQREPKRATGD